MFACRIRYEIRAARRDNLMLWNESSESEDNGEEYIFITPIWRHATDVVRSKQNFLFCSYAEPISDWNVYNINNKGLVWIRVFNGSNKF